MSNPFTPMIAEVWALYAIGTIMIFSRALCRFRLVGIHNFKPDDYLVWLAWAVYTNVTVIAHVFIVDCKGKHTSLLTHEQRQTMPRDQWEPWIYGSKIFLVGQISYAVIVWILKFNMLFFYQRVVRGLWVEKFVKPAMGLVAAAAITIAFTEGLACRPFNKLWQIWPDPGPTCVPQNKVFFYTILILNIVTDAVIMLIPAPVIAPLNANIWRRIGLYILFGMGIFCMVAAILRVILIFQLEQEGISAMWSIREDFVAVFVGQAPMIRPMFGKKFWVGGYGPGSKSYPYGDRSTGHELESNPGNLHNATFSSSKKKVKDPYSVTQVLSDSQEEIIKPGSEASQSGRTHLTVTVQRTVDVESMENTEGRAPSRVERWV